MTEANFLPLTTSLAGKVALITGGGVRVGRAIALALAQRGVNIAFTHLSCEAGFAPSAVDYVASHTGSAAAAYGSAFGARGDEVLLTAMWSWFVREQLARLADVLEWLLARAVGR